MILAAGNIGLIVGVVVGVLVIVVLAGIVGYYIYKSKHGSRKGTHYPL